MLNIMVVDDSLVIRKTLSAELEKMGHKIVVQAKSGREAIDYYSEYMPDLVTMDITMPVMDGLEALKEIKSRYSDANVIMVTSHGEEKLVMDAISNGAKGYVLKPIKKEKLEEVIKKVFPTVS
jgi:two-component system chemotaxis response regulator CheY